MRVLMLVSSSSLGNISRSLELAKFLRDRGEDVFFACDNGYWSPLVNAYDFTPISIFESRLYKSNENEIGIPKLPELMRALDNEKELILKIKPNVVISDWRMTARISTEITEVPCIQIWNSNWGLLAGHPEFVNPHFYQSYKAIVSSWQRKIDTLLNSIKISWTNDKFIMGGKFNIIPDHEIFRKLQVKNEKKDCVFVGPLVPWPVNWKDNSDKIINDTTHDITIAFGGHNLPRLKQFIMDIALFLKLRVFCLPSGPPQNLSKSLFSFFPSELLQGRFVITHGGIGSIYQSLLVGKPLLVIPQHIEHLDNGFCVERLGVGICISPEQLNKSTLIDAFDSLISNSFVEKTRNMSYLLRKSIPYENSYDLILEVNRYA